MTKPAYERPVVLDLGGRAASGQNPLACLSGGTVAALLCRAGSSDTACYAGTDGAEFSNDCRNGGAATGAYSCLAGGTAGWECASGTTPQAGGVCTAGPSA